MEIKSRRDIGAVDAPFWQGFGKNAAVMIW